jgi:hypothetical protein
VWQILAHLAHDLVLRAERTIRRDDRSRRVWWANAPSTEHEIVPLVRIKQYAYFVVRSEEIAGEVIAERIGLPGDRIRVRGSRVSQPPRPAFHTWEVVCDAPGLRVDAQIQQVFSRVGPYQSAIRKIVANDRCGATLQVVRYLGAWLADNEGEEEELTVEENDLDKLPGQHQLLGWHLDADVLAFLVDVGAQLDVDEYG